MRRSSLPCSGSNVASTTRHGSTHMPVAAIARMVDEHDTRIWRVLEHYVAAARADLDLSQVRLLFDVLAMVAEFESDLIRLRTREGMKVAKAKGRLRGKKPKLNPRQEAHLVELFETGEHSTAELAELFGVGRSIVYRALERSNSAAL